MITVRELLPRVQNNLSQLGGAGVQVYSEDVIIEKIITAFNIAFTRHFWEVYTHWERSTLDGLEGVVVDNPTEWQHPLRLFEDIQFAKSGMSCPNLKRIPSHLIPSLVTGTAPKYIKSYEIDRPEKVFRVIPFTATGDLWVRYRSRPERLNIDSLLYLDEELMKLAATWQYLADDGTNPDATNAAFGMMQTRETLVLSNMSEQNVSLTGYEFDPTAWYG